ncbi:hypothetical protein AZE42_03930 [Rhizopogon vesiculosus]|uniref:DNA mitochondrial polymerase exonuclease domain-containing protein n=1 Tax=Rhizopogon vesiculosus TaxID=180088 RepID=A0A1J8QFR0_9AGAM|nr:hypothetical protein AZE42_03930 [Rhizopogon vesiculosus]
MAPHSCQSFTYPTSSRWPLTKREFWGSTVHTVLSLAFWMKYHKETRQLKHDGEVNAIKREEVRRLRADLEERLPQLDSADVDAEEADLSSKHWEDLTSANSQADIAKLQCNIDVDKEIRHDFMKCSPEDIVDNIHDYLNYCAQHVFATHAVFSKVLPAFLERCSSPVSLLHKDSTHKECIAVPAAPKFNAGGHINHSVVWKNLAPASREGKGTTAAIQGYGWAYLRSM